MSTAPLLSSFGFVRALLLLRLGAYFGIDMATANELVWREEFDGTLDPDTWSFNTGGGGWGNDELQVYTDLEDNVAVRNGHLIITAVKTETTRGPNVAIDFTSGRIRSNGKFAFTYGIVETRVLVPALNDGLWPAFWMMGQAFDEGVGWPDCGEIDIMEMGYQDWLSGDACLNKCEPDCLGSGPSDPSCKCCGGDGTINKTINSAFHFENMTSYDGYYCDPRALADSDFAGTDKWVNLTMNWGPDLVQTYVTVDGEAEKLMCEFDISNPDAISQDLEEFHKPFFFIANLAVGGRYTGLLYQKERITAPFPAELKIDYIRLYNNSHTTLHFDSNPNPTPSPPTEEPVGCDLLQKGDTCTEGDGCCSGECVARGPNMKCN